MEGSFDFDDPNAAHLEANFFYSWDGAEEFAKIRQNAALDGKVDFDNLVALSSALDELKVPSSDLPTGREGGFPYPKSIIEKKSPSAFDRVALRLLCRASDRVALRREKARLRMARLVSNETPEERGARLARRKKSDAKYRAANWEELKHKEWRRRPGNAAWVEGNVSWNAENLAGGNATRGDNDISDEGEAFWDKEE